VGKKSKVAQLAKGSNPNFSINDELTYAEVSDTKIVVQSATACVDL